LADQTQATATVSNDELLYYRQLCQDLKVEPEDQTYLQYSANGIRGIHVTQAVDAGETLIKIPLTNSMCLRDDTSPIQITDDPNNNKWAARLAAAFLEKQASRTRSFEMYCKLLPDPDLLAASLPVHWNSDVLTMASSTALELQIDTAFFSRAQAIEDVVMGLQGKYDKQQVKYALDLVQTRSCRLTIEDGRDVRCLIPVFDMINHDVNPNAEFVLQHGYVIVRALSPLKENDQILIDYGASARPAYKCLASYGFVPKFEAEDESALAEVYLDGVRYEVGPQSIPEAMVTAMMIDDPHHVPEEVELTPEIAIRLARRLADVAFQLLLDPLEDDKDDETPSEILGLQLAKSLRWYQHRVLNACSTGLSNWAIEQRQEEARSLNP
jgi:hypothetical protein